MTPTIAALNAQVTGSGPHTLVFDGETIEGFLQAMRTRFRDWATSFAPLAMGLPIDSPIAESFLSSLLRMRPSEAVAMAHRSSTPPAICRI